MSEEKTEEATSHKLDDARKQGDVAVSKDLTEACSFIGMLLYLWLGSGFIVEHLHNMMQAALHVVAGLGRSGALGEGIAAMLMSALWVVGPPALLAVVISVAVGMLQTRGVFSTEPLLPKFEKLNPAERIKQLLSTQHLGAFVLMLLKVVLLGGVIVWVFKSFIEPLISGVHASAANSANVSFAALGAAFAGAAMVYLALGLVDYLHQWFEHLKRNRMSKTEVKQEHKDQEGSPEMKGEQRAFMKELSSGPVNPGMAKAQVLVTNPTHFAVALYYEPGLVELPMVVAKGADAVALELRAQARHRTIPIMENPVLARSLHRSVDLGQYIGDEHMEAVAEVFRWLRTLKSASPR